MTEHALAFVNYRYFRTSPENRAKYSRAYWYVSKQDRIINWVGNDGTLWIVTSRRSRKGARVYSLAYRLVNCQTFDVPKHLKKAFGKYGVMGDPVRSLHFPSNDITDVLLSLKFSPEKPMRGRNVIGISLMNARHLAVTDIQVLEEYADKVLHGKNIFISYSSKDIAFADALQRALEVRGHSVWRDVRSIVGGEQWEPAILRAIKNADAFLLMISENSARSEWVRREIDRALEMFGQPGKLQIVLPIVLSMDAWDDFPETHRFQRLEWDRPSTPEFFDRLADALGRPT